MIAYEIVETASFWETYKDILNFIVGIISGIFLSMVTFLLNYRNSWRNKLTRELTVTLKFNSKHTTGNTVTLLKLRYDINNTSGNELSINSAFLELPKDVRGNSGANSTDGETLFGTGKLYLFQESRVITHHLSGELKIEQKTLNELVNRKVKNLRVVLNTSRYGVVKSNYLKIL